MSILLIYNRGHTCPVIVTLSIAIWGTISSNPSVYKASNQMIAWSM